jgi:hypothetical protein
MEKRDFVCACGLFGLCRTYDSSLGEKAIFSLFWLHRGHRKYEVPFFTGQFFFADAQPRVDYYHGQ